MKKAIGIITILLCIGITNIVAQTEQKRTEEYAMVEFIKLGKEYHLEINIGEDIPQYKSWEREKDDKKGVFYPVIKELGKLNSLGFELLDVSITNFTYTGTSRFPRYTYMLVKKL